MNNAAMRAVMTHIGFVEAASQALIEEQGLDTFEEIKLHGDDEIAASSR